VSVDSAAAVLAAGGAVVGAASLPSRLRFCTDTRRLAPGDTYVALRGERFDGHDFTHEAIAAGASAVVVDHAGAVPPGASGIVVADTTRAYLTFGAVARAASSARVVAITGSAGKTTTKAFLAAILEAIAPGRVATTPRNENNEIGVASVLLAIPDDAAFVVVEFGARHAGDIETLARAAMPEAAVITNIGDAHLEIFGSREILAETKWGIFATGARRVLGAGDPTSRRFAERPNSAAATPTWFGVADDPPAPPGVSLTLAGRGELRLRERDGRTREFATNVSVAGDHNLRNVAAAAAAALDLGAPPATIATALETIALPAGRYERTVVDGLPGVAFIYDAYNANRSGTLATLASFAGEPATRRIAILSSMAELGDDAAAMHRDVGAAAARSGLATLLVGGDFADALAAGARAGGMPPDDVVPFGEAGEAAAWVRANARPGDVILLKGSRRYRLEEVLRGLEGARAR
jgi:UDP-N-acetylmuramoyl-tripeptide--D-alanyl-D-alanine ligase